MLLSKSCQSTIHLCPVCPFMLDSHVVAIDSPIAVCSRFMQFLLKVYTSFLSSICYAIDIRGLLSHFICLSHYILLHIRAQVLCSSRKTSGGIE